MRNTLLLGVLVLALTACAVSPTGRQQLIMLSPQQLDAMGEQAFGQMKQQKPVVTDPGMNAYVGCVARAITRQLPGGAQTWEVAVFRDESANAFALPGGKIGVFTGLLRVARTQDQLAAVIGHEVGHVLANHANERASQQYAVQGGLAVADALYGGSSGLSKEMLMQVLGLGAQVGVLLPYGRAQEGEADVIGLDLMARAGFDPRQSLALWQNMEQAGGGQPPEFLSTHPSHGTRMQELQARMGQAMQVFQAARAQGIAPRCGG